MKLKQLGANLIISDNGKSETIVFPKGYNFDKIFSLAYKIITDQSKAAENLFWKEIEKYRKKAEKSPEVIENRLSKKKIDKKIKLVKSVDVKELPIVLTPDWAKLIEEVPDRSENIKNFLIWLSMNDNENTRKNFLKEFSSKYPYITKNGYLVSIRAVWKEQVKDELYGFIQSAYVKIKGWKKAVKNYSILKKDGVYTLEKSELRDDPNAEYIGNLADLYANYKSDQKTTYISNYSKTTLGRSDNWTLGSVAEIHDKATHKEICGINQLHILSNPLDAITNKHGNYGDTYLIVLVNPKDIINAQYGWKYTTSRFYIAAEISKKEIEEYFKEHWGDFDYDYLSHDMKEVIGEVSPEVIEKNTEKKKADLALLIEEKKKLLNNKISHIEPALYQEILQNRINLVK